MSGLFTISRRETNSGSLHVPQSVRHADREPETTTTAVESDQIPPLAPALATEDAQEPEPKK